MSALLLLIFVMSSCVSWKKKKDETVEFASQTSILVNDDILDLGLIIGTSANNGHGYKPVQLWLSLVIRWNTTLMTFHFLPVRQRKLQPCPSPPSGAGGTPASWTNRTSMTPTQRKTRRIQQGRGCVRYACTLCVNELLVFIWKTWEFHKDLLI